MSCILLKFYIKPQRGFAVLLWGERCILLKFYIKPQPRIVEGYTLYRCILLKFYIKPQPYPAPLFRAHVVSYWNSTSNHNCGTRRLWGDEVVSYWNSTSNHNSSTGIKKSPLLYLIEILHQTTTLRDQGNTSRWLYLIEILHQTTTRKR